ncbi:MAG: iron chaperone [Bacteroidota bacterium]|jgi:uncharacterized protein YdhG (YjbR/CyaY superfamily)
MRAAPPDVDTYIAEQTPAVAQLLSELRQIILSSAPEASEGISYGMPAYKLHGKPLAYFAAFARHLGLYATPSSHEAFAAELSGYKQGKGSVQFPLDRPLPVALIRRMIAHRAETIQGRTTRSKQHE